MPKMDRFRSSPLQRIPQERRDLDLYPNEIQRASRKGEKSTGGQTRLTRRAEEEEEKTREREVRR